MTFYSLLSGSNINILNFNWILMLRLITYYKFNILEYEDELHEVIGTSSLPGYCSVAENNWFHFPSFLKAINFIPAFKMQVFVIVDFAHLLFDPRLPASSHQTASSPMPDDVQCCHDLAFEIGIQHSVILPPRRSQLLPLPYW